MRALGIDYGERRIGLALSDATGLIASPWKTIANYSDVKAAAEAIGREIARLRDEDGLHEIVVGLPRRLSGDPNDQTARVEKFVGFLRQSTDLPVMLQDERLTSHEAEELLSRRERDWRRRKAQLDAMSAALILQDFLDHQPRP